MMQSEKPEFRTLLDQHAEIFHAPKLTDIALQAYWNALRDVPFELVKACAQNHLRKGKFFPKPSEMRPKDWTPQRVAPGQIDFEPDLERLFGASVRTALDDRDLRQKLAARLEQLNSGANETPGSRGAFAAAYWRSVETWLEGRLGVAAQP